MKKTFETLTEAKAALDHCGFEHKNWPTADTEVAVQRAQKQFDAALAADKAASRPMQIFQLIVAPFSCDADFDEMRECAITPNPLFTDLNKAKAAAQIDADSAIDGLNEGETEPEDILPHSQLVWTYHEDGSITGEAEFLGLIYAIHTSEI